MRISDNIIIGDGIAHESKKILRAIRKDRSCKKWFWYGVTTAPEKENLMYILSGREYSLPLYRDEGLVLLGLAASRKEAMEIVLDLVQTGYNHNEIHNMKHFLETF